ncbi:MAG: BACON domain-containing protein, partial [Bacteroidales bacterium]|nr:BACON domain-containing protein [Bacteroidales bacterium]
MNFKKLFVSFIAAAAALVACTQEEDFGLPKIEVNPAELSFNVGEGSQEVEILSTRDWLVQTCPEWVAVSVKGGPASSQKQKVTISVNANPSFTRTEDVVFTIGVKKCALTIRQDGEKGELRLGSGTLEDPFTVGGVFKYVKDLGADVVSPDAVYVKGIVSSIAQDSDTFTGSGTYGNATFKISDDGKDTGDQFYCYRILYLGNRKFKSGDTDVKVGDEVIICGKVVNYKGNTPETNQGSSFLYSLNGKSEGGAPATTGDPKGSGSKDDPFNVAGAIKAVSNLSWTSNDNYQKVGPYYVKGKVSKLGEQTFSNSGTYGNASFYITDDGVGNEFYCYRVLYLGNVKYTSGDDVKVGDEVIICGELMNYRGNTPETVASSAYLYSLNGKTAGGGDTPSGTGDPKGTGAKDDPF